MIEKRFQNVVLSPKQYAPGNWTLEQRNGAIMQFLKYMLGLGIKISATEPQEDADWLQEDTQRHPYLGHTAFASDDFDYLYGELTTKFDIGPKVFFHSQDNLDLGFVHFNYVEDGGRDHPAEMLVDWPEGAFAEKHFAAMLRQVKIGIDGTDLPLNTIEGRARAAAHHQTYNCFDAQEGKHTNRCNWLTRLLLDFTREERPTHLKPTILAAAQLAQKVYKLRKGEEDEHRYEISQRSPVCPDGASEQTRYVC